MARQLSHRLYDLYDMRITADYEIGTDNPITKNAQATAQRAIETASKVLETITFLQSRNQ